MHRTLRTTLILLLTALVTLASAQDRVFRMAAYEPASLDPAIGGFGYQEYVNLYEPLVDAYRKDGTITPLAAESWTIEEDGRVFVFTLRPGLRWSDGEPLTMQHYYDGWMRMLNPATAAYAPQNLFAIENAEAYNLGQLTDPSQVGLEVVDDLTLRVTLATPTPFFLASVGRQEFFPMRLDLIERHGDQWMEAGNHVGNGPFMLAEWAHDQRMVFVQNPHYEGFWKDTRHVDRIEYTLLADPWSQSVPGFETGELDVGVVPAADLDRVRNDAELLGQPAGAADLGRRHHGHGHRQRPHRRRPRPPCAGDGHRLRRAGERRPARRLRARRAASAHRSSTATSRAAGSGPTSRPRRRSSRRPATPAGPASRPSRWCTGRSSARACSRRRSRRCGRRTSASTSRCSRSSRRR